MSTLPDSINDNDAAGFIVNPLIAAAMFADSQAIGSPSIMLTTGASQVTKFIIALARNAGIPMIAVVRRDVHNKTLRELGVTAIVNQTDSNFEEQFAAAVREHKPQTFIDAVVDSTSTKIFTAMGRDSAWVIYGSLSSETPPLSNPGELIFMNKTIRGFWLTPWMTETSIEAKFEVFGEVQARFSDGRWSTDIGATVNLAGVMDTLADTFKDPQGKVFIKP